ncbi:MAG: Dihydroxy-acid dehydratase, partial [Hyphomicrobiales bacterium]|nr:Dihydroxy-acid dehydratase [Hyphomicrobiales bacterium]
MRLPHCSFCDPNLIRLLWARQIRQAVGSGVFKDGGMQFLLEKHFLDSRGMLYNSLDHNDDVAPRGAMRGKTTMTAHDSDKPLSEANGAPKRLRSRAWFDNPENPDMTALYLERYLNFGISREELQSGKPIIGIAQTGSDLSPCNRHHIVLAERVREGIREAGGIALEFPVHPIQETGKRPTAGLDRNLAYLSLVEVLYGYPLDGVV